RQRFLPPATPSTRAGTSRYSNGSCIDGSRAPQSLLVQTRRMHTAIPVSDISPLASRDTAQRARVAAEVGAACRDVGFFAITGHGVAPALLADAFAAGREFFALDRAAKQAIAIGKLGHNRGYVDFGAEALDEKKGADQK